MVNCSGNSHEYFNTLKCWEEEHIFYALITFFTLGSYLIIVFFLEYWYLEPVSVEDNIECKSTTYIEIIFLSVKSLIVVHEYTPNVISHNIYIYIYSI